MSSSSSPSSAVKLPSTRSQQLSASAASAAVTPSAENIRLPSSPLTEPPVTPRSSPLPSLVSSPSSSSTSSCPSDDIDDDLFSSPDPSPYVPMSARSPFATFALVKQEKTSYPPILTPGNVSPEVAQLFERKCRNYFAAKKPAADDQVPLILPGIEDARYSNWVEVNRATLEAGSFDDFLAAFRERVLPKDWQEKTRISLYSETMKPEDKFQDFSDKMESTNTLLMGSPHHLDETHLRHLLESKIVSDLSTRLKSKTFADDVTFRVWARDVAAVDEVRHDDLKRMKDFIDQANRDRERDRSKRPFSEPSRNANTISNSGNASSSSSRPQSTPNAGGGGNRTRPASLEPSERQLLRDNDGCLKCRRLFCGHKFFECPNGFPGPNCQKITAAVVAAARATQARRGIPAKAGKAVASVEGVDDEIAPVAAVLPSSALGDGSDSESEVCAPLQVKHLRWKCLLSGTLTEFPVPVLGMIDSGAHVVLISPALVDSLGLRRLPLPKPMNVTVALESEQTKSFTSLSEFVKIAPFSPDLAWTSRTVRAIIAPGLCSPIIFGLPFLQMNSLVIDAEARTIIDKKCGYDLLDPPPPPVPAEPKLKLREKIKQTQDDIKLLKAELKWKCAVQRRDLESNYKFEDVKEFDVVGAVRARIETLADLEALQRRENVVKAEFEVLFEPIPHVDDLPTEVVANIQLIDASKTIHTRNYQCPRKYRDAWHTLLKKHLDAGRIRPLSSQFASPSFVIPKADPTALPRWVNDFRQLNSNTVPDRHPLARVDDILADCAKGKIWGVIDMTDSFFQTKMNPKHIPLTAITTPFGLYEWVVMPMGLRNAPAIHQRRVVAALRDFIGKICHVYLDDIVIWSQTVDEHEKNVRTILQALKDARLYCNPKKTHLFCLEIDFLGHHISQRGIEACDKKVDKILSWPVPKSATEVKGFLGLVRYIADFLPDLAEHTRILNLLTTKDSHKNFPTWTDEHQVAFEGIKNIVVSRKCLTTIDHDALGENKIFVTTDASEFRSGAVLSFGPTWETARPVAFDSMTFKGAELNYPVHEKEMLAIIRALKRWKVDLLGSPFLIYTDHKTLENFDQQKDLSRRQARWMEFMSMFESKIIYVKGEDNTVADALSRLPVTLVNDSIEAEDAAGSQYGYCTDDEPTSVGCILSVNKKSPWRTARELARMKEPPPLEEVEVDPIAVTLEISADKSLLASIRAGYEKDPWCKKLESTADGIQGIEKTSGLWYVGGRLIVPRVGNVREQLFRIAHDALGHFGFEKSYGSLRNEYYWPNMRTDLEQGYVPACVECQRNKGKTGRKAGPMHPLPVPDGRGDSVAIDFIGPLPLDEGYDCIVTMTDRLGADIVIAPTNTTITAEKFAVLFFDRWYCENGLPLEIISDRDKLFVSKFWKALHKLTGVKIKMSTAYHPRTDGSSERSNKTVNQCVRFHVRRNQKGWVRALPRVRFDIMNTVNKSTGFSGFQLKMGRSPRVMPPLVESTSRTSDEEVDAARVIRQLEDDVGQAQDSLLMAKIAQAEQFNKSRGPAVVFEPGDRVMLSTFNRRWDYKKKGEKRVAKFMPRFDGPYQVLLAHPQFSTYELDLPNSPNIFPVFHTDELVPYVANNAELFPSRELERPAGIQTEDGEEFEIEEIIDERRRGRGCQYLVRWRGYGPEEDRWIAAKELDNCEALDRWIDGLVPGRGSSSSHI